MKRHILTAAILAIGGFGLAAQAQQQDQAAGAAAQPGAQQPSAQPGAAQQPAQPADQAQAAADRTREAGQASRSEASQALSQVSQAILSKGGPEKLSDSFAREDQSRLQDLSKEAQQIDQSAEQLRQAFKNKYQQDLDVSASADRIFSSTFIQIGSAADQAQSASGRLAPDSGATAQPGAGAQQSDAAAARTNADAAQPAAATSGQQTAVTISSSAAAAPTRVNLVKEGSSWKIKVPESVDARKLSQSIQQHLQMALQSKDQWPADATEGQRAIVQHVLMAFSDASAPSARDAAGARDTTATPGSSSGTGAPGAAGTGGVSR
jgi:hypothetical protein